jgi:hypothetical protein
VSRYREAGSEFTVGEHLNQVVLLNDTGVVKRLWVDFSHPVLLADGLQAIKVESNVFRAVGAVEATLGQTHLQGHLTTFEVALAFVTTTGFCPFVTAGGGTTTTGTLAPGDSLAGLGSAGGWFEIIKFHDGIFFNEVFRGSGVRVQGTTSVPSVPNCHNCVNQKKLRPASSSPLGFFYFYKVTYFGNHSLDNGRIFPLHGLVDFTQAQCFDRVLLFLRTVDHTLNLGDFNLSHARFIF